MILSDDNPYKYMEGRVPASPQVMSSALHCLNQCPIFMRSILEFQRFRVSAFFLAAPLHLERDFRVDAVACDLLSIHTGAEFLDVNGTDIAQCLRGLHDYILRRVLPTFRRFRKYLDHFYDFWHEVDFLSLPFRAGSRIWPQGWPPWWMAAYSRIAEKFERRRTGALD